LLRDCICPNSCILITLSRQNSVLLACSLPKHNSNLICRLSMSSLPAQHCSSTHMTFLWSQDRASKKEEKKSAEDAIKWTDVFSLKTAILGKSK